MKTALRWPRGLPWLAPLVTLALGCATLKLPAPPVVNLSGERQQRRQEAVRQFDEGREMAELQSAQASWDRGDAKACEQSLQSLLKRNPAHRDARLLLAKVHLAGQRTAEACEELKQALQAHPDDAKVQYVMGLALELTDRRGEALAYYERAAKWEPDNELYAVGYHTALEAARQPDASTAGSNQPRPTDAGTNSLPRPASGTWRDARKPPEAGNIVNAGVKKPRDAPAAAGVGPGSQLGSNLPALPEEGTGIDAVEPFGRAGSAGTAGSEPCEALLRKGDAALRQGSPEAALAYFREAASLRPNNPQILISAATTALRHNQPDLAMELLEPAEKRFVGSAQLHRILGAAYYRLGDYQSSQVALQQALSLDKSNALSYFLMGCTLLKLGQHGSAEAHFRQAQALDPRYTVRR